jgi:hypothetical protein
MIVPIIIPHRTTEEPVCPKCGMKESKIEVCEHCGYKYEDDDGFPVIGCLFAALIIIIVIWLFITLFSWLFLNFDNLSLVEIFKSQWHWLKSLKIV